MKIALDQELVKKYFECREDGHLYWIWHHSKRTMSKFKGKPFGCVSTRGYVEGTLLGLRIDEHRLAFLYHHGYIPNEIDHWDKDKTNNQKDNLRDVTRTQNNHNQPIRADNKTGVKGAYWHRQNKKWVSRIKIEGKSINLGSFNTLEEARLARQQAEETYL